MKLLKRRRPSGIDPALGDPEIRQGLERFEAGDWAELERLFEQRSDAWVISALLHSPHQDLPIARFEAWAVERGTALALTHLGRARLRHAAGRRHEETDADPEQLALEVYAGLKDAEALLRQAADLDPDSAEPWVGLMATAQGFRLPRTELHDRFVEAHTREPFRPDACQQMLKSMCARSGGSHEQMFEFARWLRTAAPVESPCQTMISLAHIEYAFATEDLFDSGYLQRNDVADELKSMARSYLLATADGPAPAQHLQAVNLLLLAIEPNDPLSGAILREVVSRVDDRPTALPWTYFDDGVDDAFDRVLAKRAKAANKI